MPTDAPTDYEIEKLIRDAHDGLLNPHDEEKAEKRFERFYRRGPAQEVLNVGYDPEPDYEWDSDRAFWLLEDYLIDIPSRIEALAEGAEPTDQERQWYREAADKEIEERCWYDVTRVYRLASSEQSAEKRAVFFIWKGVEGGQWSDTTECYGPLCDVEEILKNVMGCGGDIFDYELRGEFPERAVFEKHLVKTDFCS